MEEASVAVFKAARQLLAGDLSDPQLLDKVGAYLKQLQSEPEDASAPDAEEPSPVELLGELLRRLPQLPGVSRPAAGGGCSGQQTGYEWLCGLPLAGRLAVTAAAEVLVRHCTCSGRPLVRAASALSGALHRGDDASRLQCVDLIEAASRGGLQQSVGAIQLPFDPAYTQGELPNGMQYYVRRNAKPEKRIELRLVLRVGSAVEEEEERGLAHLVEHLAFRATKDFDNFELVRIMEKHGTSFGCGQNAFTNFDETVYMLHIASHKPCLLDEALHVLSEWAAHVRCSDDDVDRERGIVLEEARRQATQRISEALLLSSLEGSRYAKRLPIGLREVVRGAPAETVRAFYRKWYHPALMAVVVIGDVDPQEVTVQLHERFAWQPRGPPPELPTWPTPLRTEFAVESMHDPETTQSVCSIAFTVPPPRLRTVGDYRRLLAQELFACAVNQRLYRVALGNDAPFYSAIIQRHRVTGTAVLVECSVQCTRGEEARATEGALRELYRATRHGFPEDEIAHARATTLAAVSLNLLEKDQLESDYLCEALVKHIVHGEECMDPEAQFAIYAYWIPLITAEEVRAAAAVLANPIVGVGRSISKAPPVRCPCPRAPPYRNLCGDQLRQQLHAAVAAAAAADLEPWVHREPCLASGAAAGAVTERVQVPQCGAVAARLGNGLRVWLRPADFLNDEIRVQVIAPGGLCLAEPEALPNARVANALAEQVGCFGLPPEDLELVLSSGLTRFSTTVETYRRMLHGYTSPRELDLSLKLIAALFATTVRIEESSRQRVSKYMAYYRESIEEAWRDPQQVYNTEVLRVNTADNPYARNSTLEDVDRIDPDAALEFFNQLFRNPADFCVVLCGAFDPDHALALAAKYLGGLPSGPQLRARDLRVPLPSRNLKRTVWVSPFDPHCRTQVTYPVVCRSLKEENTLSLLKELVQRRLLQMLRFKHGAVYSVTAHVMPDLHHPTPISGAADHQRECLFAVTFTNAPRSSVLNLLQREVAAQLRALAAEGPSEQDVVTLVECERRLREEEELTNTFWATRLGRIFIRGGEDSNLSELIAASEAARTAALEEASIESLRDSTRRLLPPDGCCTVVDLRPPWADRRILAAGLTVAAALVAAGAVRWRRPR
eukprot:TRINITY_DN23781_c0_g1_i1.p1 TRINITY_DN23781_c0_g1~~TRINITY_DN23781_c0_g1_i1.p1  ORF type:complete len:1151 (+),score=361.79 TRINITY_DN23781_c0_g1_i1:84-3455(+)